jgi:hypothetical protein
VSGDDKEKEKEKEKDDTGQAAKAAALLGAIFSVAGSVLYGTRTGGSVAIGAFIAVANLLMMRAIIRSVLTPPPDDTEEKKGSEAQDPKHRAAGRRGGVAWGVFAVLKIFLLFGGVWILLTRHMVDPIPLVVGYGVLPLGIAASSLWSSLFTREP